MSIEQEIADLTTAATSLNTAVGQSKTILDNASTAFAATTARVDALPNVENTADVDKPVSSATQTALNDKQDELESGTNLRTINGNSLLGNTDLSITVLATVYIVVQYDDRRDVCDSTYLASRILNNTIIVRHIGTLRWTENTLEPDDDETCFTADDLSGQWVLAEPHYDLLAAHAMVDKAFRDELHEDELNRFTDYLTTQGLI